MTRSLRARIGTELVAAGCDGWCWAHPVGEEAAGPAGQDQPVQGLLVGQQRGHAAPHAAGVGAHPGRVRQRVDLGEPRLVASVRGTRQVAFAVIATTAFTVLREILHVQAATEGRLDRRLEVPAAKPAMCAFGGSDLATLYVTSIRPGDAPADSPAGALFALRPGVCGLAETACTPRSRSAG